MKRILLILEHIFTIRHGFYCGMIGCPLGNNPYRIRTGMNNETKDIIAAIGMLVCIAFLLIYLFIVSIQQANDFKELQHFRDQQTQELNR